MRATYQSLASDSDTRSVKGPYPIFDNVAAIFSATPVITRTATYLYACTEWVEDAFKGRELMHDIYSRLLNPTSVSLANHIVDLEAGPLSNEYMAWNFNSGMAAVDVSLPWGLCGRRRRSSRPAARRAALRSGWLPATARRTAACTAAPPPSAAT